MKKCFVIAVLLLSIVLWIRKAQSQAPFYLGKTIKIVVGFTSGGFYDRWARLLARHLPKYIPGNPDMIVQNMPGPDL